MVAGETSDAGDTDRAVWRLPRKPESIPDGRHLVRLLALCVFGQGDCADRAQVCASELLTNAFVHGAGPDIRLTVHDDGGTGRIVAPGHDDLDCQRVNNGRGLFLVAEMADRWRAAQPRHRGTTVWFEIDL